MPLFILIRYNHHHKKNIGEEGKSKVNNIVRKHQPQFDIMYFHIRLKIDKTLI